MSRLYYEPSILPTAENSPVKETAPADNKVMDYLDKVSKLVPAEILAAYLTMFGLVESIKSATTQLVSMWIVFAAGSILTPIYLNLAAEAGKPKTRHLILSTIAFLVWAYVTTGKTLSASFAADAYDPAVASIVLILFSVISGAIKLDK